MWYRTPLAMAPVLLVLLARVAVAGIPPCTTGAEVQWTPASGGNGHFYQAVCPPLFVTWEEAHTAATASGRHLATLTSSAENAFAFALVNDQNFWFLNEFTCNIGPWLGGRRSSPGGPFTWVTGEPFSFTAWSGGEPNNSGGTEDKIHFFNCQGGAVRSANWNDVTATVPIAGYVTEWSHSLDVDGDGEIEPLTDGLLILRDLFGFTGTALTNAAVDLSDCTRCDDATIEPFLDLAVAGRVYDVGDDWSDEANPNGPWSYLEGTNPLPHVAAWQSSVGGYASAQPAWAASENGNNRIPLFMKSFGFETFVVDYLDGDVVTHTRDDANGVGMGDGRVRFTAPATGIHRITAAVWVGREIGRSVDWTLLVDGVQQASGTVASGDAFSRAAPDGYQGSFALEAGDEVDLLLTTDGTFGDFAGFDLRLEAFGLDVDGDGEALALTDGLLILRYLFGFTAGALVNGAVDLVNCTRCDAASIEAFLDSFG